MTGVVVPKGLQGTARLETNRFPNPFWASLANFLKRSPTFYPYLRFEFTEFL